MPDLQFENAEYAAGVPTCVLCKEAIHDRYWMSGANSVCNDCKVRVEAGLAQSGWRGFGRAALFGLGAAAAGGVAWYAVREVSGYDWGILAIGVAWLVASAVRSGGGGSLPQQFLATGLTYLAVVGSMVPTLFGLATEGATAPIDYATAAVLAVGGALVFPVFVASAGDFLWFIIVGIALWSAFRRSARPRVVWAGPFAAPAAAGAPLG